MARTNNFYNLEYERAILGSILLKSSVLTKELAEMSFNAGFFYDENNRQIYGAIGKLHQSNIVPDIMTLTEQLTTEGLLEKVGGASSVASLTDYSNVANISFYAEQVKALWQKRQLYTCINDAQIKLKSASTESKDIINGLSDSLITMQMASSPKDFNNSLSDLVTAFKLDCEKKRASRLPYTGIPTGLKFYDDVTSGMQDEEFIIIAARPSMGKTALAISVIENMITKGIPVGFFSLEMSAMQIIQRFLAIETQINLYFIRQGLKSDQDFNRVFDERVIKTFTDKPLHLIDETNINIHDLKAKARYLKTVFDIKILFIDYIGLIDSGMAGRPVYEQQSFVSKELKKLSKELKIPVVALCQVARAAEDKAPTIADLRGSGSIEQDADQVILLHGDRFEDKPVQDRLFILAKNRNGMTFQNSIKFVRAYTQYREE